MNVKIQKLHPDAQLPQWNNKSAGCDLSSTEDYTLQPGERKLFKTGLAIAIPTGHYGRIAPRSGLAYKDGLDVLAGVIDEDYRGDIGVILINFGQKEKLIKKGDKIAQLIFEAYYRFELGWSETLDETTRGAGGYGSTDKVKLNLPASVELNESKDNVFKLLGPTTIEKHFKNQLMIDSVKSGLANYQGEIYLYQENGKRGLCVVDYSGTILKKFLI